MKYRDWRRWVRTKPWSLRWFIFLVLFRPVIDSFYSLKEISPFLSPLYIVGVLTPILILLALSRNKGHFGTLPDKVFRSWSFMVLFSTIMLLVFSTFSLDMLSTALKITMPVYLFFMLRLLIKDKQDIEGLITTFLYSMIFVMITFFYEVTFGPIRLTQSRGLLRIQGNFGDVFNYGLYLCFTTLFVAYYQLKKIKKTSLFERLRIVLLIGMGLFMLAKINHAASIIVFTTIIFYYIYTVSRRNILAVIVYLILGGFIIHLSGDKFLEESVSPLFERDMKVISGELNQEQMFHGRFGRWIFYLEFFASQNIMGQAIGIPVFTHGQAPYLTTGSASHNDYIRIMFLTGIVGLILYLSFLWLILRRIRGLPLEERFLGTGGLLLLVLYSITLTPTLYAPLLYMVFGIFSYVIVARKRLPNRT